MGVEPGMFAILKLDRDVRGNGVAPAVRAIARRLFERAGFEIDTADDVVRSMDPEAFIARRS